ncbi:MAG: hypothetical protein OXI87_11165 [Albidovulum sp.]|nr:hypothetical protein [Albidovulum sp.]
MISAVPLERAAFKPVRYAGPTTGLLTAFGVTLILQYFILRLVSPRPIAVTSLFLDRPIAIGSIRISSLQIFETNSTVAAFAFLAPFLRKSKFGLAMRTAAHDYKMAILMGIRANRVVATAFAVSGLLAGIASVFII